LKEKTYDLFSGFNQQDAMWMESIHGLESAKFRMEQVATENPGAYFLFDLTTSTTVGKTNTLISTQPPPKGTGESGTV
jgi:hypothetical protein